MVPPPDSVLVGVRLEKNAWGLMKWDRGKRVIAIVIMTIEELQLQLQSNVAGFPWTDPAFWSVRVFARQLFCVGLGCLGLRLATS